jgi:hypothetical protein
MASEKQIETDRRNANGLRSRKVLFNNEGELDEIREALIAEWQPQTYTEATLVEQAAVALLKRTAFEELEANVAEELMASNLAGLQALWRRQAALAREFHKALDQLVKLRRARAQTRPTRRQVEVVPEPESPAPDPSRLPDIIYCEPIFDIEPAGDPLPRPRSRPACPANGYDPPAIATGEPEG